MKAVATPPVTGDPESTDPSRKIFTDRVCLALILLAGLFLVRLGVIKHYGVQEPYMDSFSEVHDYKAALAGDYGKVLQNAFELHNEHRLPLTRFLGVGLFLLNGGHWDLLAGACVNAVLALFCVWAIIGTVGRHLPDPAYVGLLIILALAFVLPFSFENILWDFQSQHFFFILFSTLNLGLCLSSERLDRRWVAGLLCSIFACISVGSGFYAPLCVVATCAFMLLRRAYRTAQTMTTLAAHGAVVAGYLPFVLQVHSYAYGRATSVKMFLGSLLRHLAYPNINWVDVWLVPFVWLPVILLAWAAFRRERPLPRSSYVIFALTGWSLIIAVTLSFLRGVYAPYVRYFDYYSFQVLANALAIFEICRLRLFRAFPTAAICSFVAAWSAVVTLGYYDLYHKTSSYDLLGRYRALVTEQRAIQQFLRSGNEDVLQSPELGGVFPFDATYGHYLAETLSDPTIKDFLPEAMKNPDLVHERVPGPVSAVRHFLLRKQQYLDLIYFAAIALWIAGLVRRPQVRTRLGAARSWLLRALGTP